MGIRMNFFPEVTTQPPESTGLSKCFPARSELQGSESQSVGAFRKSTLLSPRCWGWLWLCQAQGFLPKGQASNNGGWPKVVGAEKSPGLDLTSLLRLSAGGGQGRELRYTRNRKSQEALR